MKLREIIYISQNSDNDRLRYRLCNQVLQSLFLLIFLIYNFHCYRRQWQNLSLLLKWLNFSHSAIFPLWFPVFTQVSFAKQAISRWLPLFLLFCKQAQQLLRLGAKEYQYLSQRIRIRTKEYECSNDGGGIIDHARRYTWETGAVWIM